MSLHSRADWPEATFLWKFLSKIELSASCDIVLSWMYFKPHKTNMMFKVVVLSSSVQAVSTWRVSLASLHCLARVRHVVISQWWWCAWVFVFMSVFYYCVWGLFSFSGVQCNAYYFLCWLTNFTLHWFLNWKYLPFMLFSISVCVLGASLDMVVNIYIWGEYMVRD